MAGEKNRFTHLTLIERIRDVNDLEAWNEFQQFYWSYVVGWARRKSCPSDLAEDVFQETMICLMRNRYDPSKGSFTGYLRTIAERRAVDIIRRESRYVPASDNICRDDDSESFIDRLSAVSGIESEFTLDRIWLDSVIVQALRRAYKRVEIRTYKAFCLYVLDQIPADDVCKRLDIPNKGTLYERKSSFLKILEQEFFSCIDTLEQESISKRFRQRESFRQVLESFIRNKPEFRETLLSSLPPSKLLDRMELVRDIMNRFPPPASAPEHYCFCNEKWIALRGKTSWSIGRSGDTDITLPAEEASGLHASLEKTEKGICLKDENSTNGTYLNGNRISEKLILRPGDIIQIADAVLVFI